MKLISGLSRSLGPMICAAAVLLLRPATNAQVNVLTQHNNNARTGANLNETILNTSNVNVTQFGLLLRRSLDSMATTQPLYVSSVTIGGTPHNVVYVCTDNNSVYAFDADDTGGSPAFWHVNLGTAPTASGAGLCGGDIKGKFGIIGSPVIDATTGTLYVVAVTLESGSYIHRLHAIDLATGAEKFGGPVQVTTGGFSGVKENQRAALLLVNGVVYVAYGSHCDFTPYHGYLIGYNATTLAQVTVFNTTPSGSEGSIWQGAAAPAADANGNIYAIVANGSWDGTANFGESVLKLTPNAQGVLGVADWFTPHDWSTLNGVDNEMGSQAPVLIPNTTLLVGGGKPGKLYLLDETNMGHINSTDAGAKQVWQAVTLGGCGNTPPLHATPVFWQSATNGPVLYVWGAADSARAYKFNGTTFSTTPFSVSTVKAPSSGCGSEGGCMSLSANGSATGSGILWANCTDTGDANGTTVSGVLRALNAENLSQELWNSKTNATRDSSHNYAKHTSPTIANGKVYLSTYGTATTGSGELCIYGLLAGVPPQVAAPTFTPVAGTYVGSQSVTIATTTSGASIRYTIDGSTPSETAGTLYTGPVTLASTTTLKAIAYKSGFSDSLITTGAYTIYPAGTFILQASGLSPTGSGQTITTTVDNAAPGGDWVKIATTAVGQFISFTTPSIAAGTYQLQFCYRTNPTRGQHSIVIDGTQVVGAFDQYAASPSTYPTAVIGNVTLTSSGAHTIQLNVTGHNAASTGFDLSAVQFILVPQSGGQVAAPSFNPGTGIFTTAQDVAITTSTGGASIRYTTDGSTPTETNGTLYTAPVHIAATTTLQAIAYESGLADSAVTSATYTIATSGTITLQASQLSPTGSGQTITTTTDAAAPGGDWVKIASTAVGQFISFTTPTIQAGTYQLQFCYRTNPTRAQHNITLDSTQVATAFDQYAPSPSSYLTSVIGNVTFATTASHTLQLTVSGHNAASTGFDVSAVQFILVAQSNAGQAAAPSFSPGGGTFSNAQDVTISTSTSGATIRYTTDGSTPSETNGTVYLSPVHLAASATLQAIGYASGMTDSAITSATYTINPTLLEAENMTPTGTAGIAITNNNDAGASGGVWVLLQGTATGQFIQFTTPSLQAGTYQLQLQYKTNTQRGQHNVMVDGTTVGGTVDQYSTTLGFVTVTLGNVTLSAGTHTIKLNVTGHNAASTGYYVSADSFTLVPQ